MYGVSVPRVTGVVAQRFAGASRATDADHRIAGDARAAPRTTLVVAVVVVAAGPASSGRGTCAMSADDDARGAPADHAIARFASRGESGDGSSSAISRAKRVRESLTKHVRALKRLMSRANVENESDDGGEEETAEELWYGNQRSMDEGSGAGRSETSSDGEGEGNSSCMDSQHVVDSSLGLYARLGEHTKSGKHARNALAAARTFAAIHQSESESGDEDEDESFETASGRVYEGRTFKCFTVDHPVRKLCIRIVEHPKFDFFILGLIAANTVLLCLSEPEKLADRGCGAHSTIGARNQAIENSELVFTVLFATEALTKMIALGFVGKHVSSSKKVKPYLRDSWNAMDFVIVIFSILSQLPGVGDSNLSTLRLARILRPLRTISMFPSLRLLVTTMLTSLPMLGNVVVFFVLFFCIMGIMGVQMFSGKLANRCYTLLPAATSCDNYSAQPYVNCVAHESGVDAILLSENEDQACGTSSMASWKCSGDQACLVYKNSNYGYTSFDNVWWSWLVIFQTITLETWVPIMYDLIDSVSPASVIWFLPVLLLGAFVILNLALAIITMVYDSNIMTELQSASMGISIMSPFLGLQRSFSNASDEAVTRISRLSSFAPQIVQNWSQVVCKWFMSQVKTWFGWKETIQPRVRALVESELFFYVINASILANTFALAMEYDGMSESYADDLELVNFSFTVVFMLEMVLKLIGFGFKEYIIDKFNRFDASIVIVSAVEMGLSGVGKSNFTMLRAFRVFRLLKVVRSWTQLQSTLRTMWKTMLDLTSFVVILCLFCLIFALVGMQVFGGKYCKIDPKPRSNFDTFNNALLTVLQVITHEDWPLVLYDTMYTSGSASVIYFIVTLVLGDFIVLNSLIAILLSNFDDRKESIIRDMEAAKGAKGKSIFGALGYLFPRSQVSQRESDVSHSEESPLTSSQEKFAALAHRLLLQERRKDVAKQEEMRMERARKLVELENDKDDVSINLFANRKKKRGSISPMKLTSFQSNSLYIFKPSNRLRKICFRIADDKRFEWVVLMCIICSSLIMVFETPENMERASFSRNMDIMDYIFTAVFTLEMLMKWIALGVYNRDAHCYLKNPWNILDGVIVVISLIGLGIQAAIDVGWVRALRTLRILRPLRLLGRVKGLKVVVNALISSLPGLGYVLLLSAIVWLIFAIAGMSLFMGKFVSCSDPTITTKAECVDSTTSVSATRVWDVLTGTCNDSTISTEVACTGSYTSTTVTAREWISSDSNFNSFPRAMLTLFEVTAGEGWTVVMYNGEDAVGTDVAMRREANPVATWYFVTFVVLSNFFLLNMCIGIVIDNFLKISTSTMSRTMMSESQSRWVNAQRNKQFTANTSFFAPPPEERWRKALVKFIEDIKFDYFIMGSIVLNAVMLMTESHTDSSTKTQALTIINYIFTGIFTTEAMLKIAAYYPKRYFSSGWNVFDFLIVVSSIIGSILGTGGGSSAFRAMRICRVFRMVKKWKALNTLFQTLVMTIPALGNIALLLSLLFFTYAILGVQVFGRIAYGEALSRHANFKDFGGALLTLLRVLTGEGWQEIMYDTMNMENCDSSQQCAIGTCCGTYGASLYFVSFVAFSSFVVLNLLIAVVLDNYSMSQQEAKSQLVSPSDVKDFRRIWKLFDPELTGFVQTSDVHNIVCLVPPPLGLKGQRTTDLALLQFMKSLNVHEGSAKFVHYVDVLQALSARAMGVDFNYLPLEVRKELESERGEAKKRALSKIKFRARRRAARAAADAEMATDHHPDAKSKLVCSVNRDIDETEFEPITGIDGAPLSVSTLLIVLKLQRAFRDRQALKKQPRGDARAVVKRL